MRSLMQPKTTFRAACAAIFTLAALSGCHGDAKKQEPKAKGAAPAVGAAGGARAVRVATVETRALPGGVAASGVLVSREEAAVSAEVSGYRVSRVLVEMGQQVRAGQPLAELDDTLLRSQIDQQSALAAQAEVAARQAEAQAARVTGLDGSGVMSEEQIQDRRFQAEAARAAANAQAAGVRDLRNRQARMVVRAPVGGLVLERTVRPGDLSGGGQAMFRIARDNLVELAAELPESAIAAVNPGDPVEVSLPSGQTFQGVVRLISPNVNPQTKLGEVRVRLPISRALRPGGFARALFTAASQGVTSVPESALRYDADGVSVMVVDAQNKVHKVLVRPGRRGGGYVELLAGPQAGSRVLLGSSSFVLEGDTVRPVQAAAPAAAASARK